MSEKLKKKNYGQVTTRTDTRGKNYAARTEVHHSSIANKKLIIFSRSGRSVHARNLVSIATLTTRSNPRPTPAVAHPAKEDETMKQFAPSINQDFKRTGRYFVVNANLPGAGKRGEAVKFTAWGGVVLILDGEEKTRTYAIGDVKETTP